MRIPIATYLFLYMAGCSVFYYLATIGFVRTIGFIGRKTKDKIYLQGDMFLLIWPMAVAVVVVPFLFAVFFHDVRQIWFGLL